MPSLTNSSSVSSYVPVALSLILLLAELIAYKGALPLRSSHIRANFIQPSRALPSADTINNRAKNDEYRIDTGMLPSRSGLGIGSFGTSVSCATASLRAKMLRTAAFPKVFDIWRAVLGEDAAYAIYMWLLAPCVMFDV